MLVAVSAARPVDASPPRPGAADPVVVVAGGAGPLRRPRSLGAGGLGPVIAADSGVGHALALGLHVDVVVGDLDSVRPDDLAQARASGAVVEQHPTDKDKTDLELALDRAVAACAQRPGAELVVLASADGRLDHALANLLVLASPAYRAATITAYVGDSVVRPVWDRRSWPVAPGDVVTLLALGGAAAGVRTEGLRYALAGAVLHPGSTRGVSNEAVGDRVAVEVRAGVLLAVHQPTESAPWT